MLKKTLVTAATAVALSVTAVATAAPANAQNTAATTIPIAAQSGYVEVGGGKNHGNWNGNDSKHRGHKTWKPRRTCQPIVRWKKVGYRYHRRWQPIVVGWDCHRKGHKGHKNWRWH